MLSLPVRGAWIEMRYCKPVDQEFLSLPVRGAWIEIFLLFASRQLKPSSRSPCGERGLK